MLGLPVFIARLPRKVLLSPLSNKTVATTLIFGRNKSTSRAIDNTKITAYAHFLKNTKKEDHEKIKDVSRKWTALSVKEKLAYAIRAAKKDPRVSIPNAKLPNKMTVHKVFLKDISNPNISQSEIQVKWNALTPEDKRSLQVRADDFNTINALHLDEPPLSAAKNLSGYKIFLMESSGCQLKVRAITDLWKSLTEDERQVYHNRAQEIIVARNLTTTTVVHPNRPLAPGKYFVKKQVEAGTTLEDARQKWEDMTIIERAEFTIINMKKTPHLITAPKKLPKYYNMYMVFIIDCLQNKIKKKLIAEKYSALTQEDKDKLQQRANELNTLYKIPRLSPRERDNPKDNFLQQTVGNGALKTVVSSLWSALLPNEKSLFE